ncbi:NADH-dependent flavin oxidoreductase [Pseudomonas sp. zfem002]|uniref:NADH-dependent flavin oxidoreductase n=1 Tax=Pseudomonas sp. zfem002 TaxID=3078197 RepID=UPI0029281B4E|nr:NADH-dependent flavin oxidoreductase [Pseudomonas sp. zfem002]MDU9394702.1 NADH-dependent flavin oxidoreductase [Pseudomonas sp. zfem002]
MNVHAFPSALFEPIAFAKGISLRNRIAMAPMTTWSANPDGTISDQEIAYYRRRATGVGLVLTGCTHVQDNGIGFTDEFAGHDDRFVPSLRRLAEAARSGGGVAILQIFHAGNKANPALIPDGDVVSASALNAQAGPFNSGDVVSRAMSHEEIVAAIRAFGQTTRRAIEAGFDGVELHGAHGFLLQNFLSPRFNQRSDEWGATDEGRLQFPLAVLREVRRVIDAHASRPFLVGYRLSPEESMEGGLRLEHTRALIDRLIDNGLDYLHASLVDVLHARPVDAVDERLTATLIVEHVAGRVPVIAAGQIRTPGQADAALALGLSLVAIGKGLVMNPQWVEQAMQQAPIATALSSADVQHLDIPDKLWLTIQATQGWFPVQPHS